nr:hypothetical protein CFP56_59729 [Quercus suber]
MVLGLKPMGKLDTYREMKALDRTKALHGPRIQAYGETNRSAIPGVRVTRTRTWTLELLLYYLSRLRLSVHRFFLEAARVLEVARIRCFLVS